MHAEFLLSREQANKFRYAAVKNPSAKPHFHSQLEFCLVESGEVEVWINGNYKKLRAGDASLAFSFDAHAYRTPKECRGKLIIIPTDLCPDILTELHHKHPKNPFINSPDLYDLICSCCEKVCKDPFSITARGYLYVMLGTILEQTELSEREQPIETDKLTRLLFYINEHYKEDISLASLSRQFGYHENLLSRQFKKTFQVCFNEYLNMLRLRTAVEKMREGKGTVENILFESGFSSTRTFYRVFTKEFGISPKQYMKRSNTPTLRK